MLHALSKLFYDRRSGLVKAASYAGSVYVVSQYVSERLGDVREKVVQERQARENLRRRFTQNQQDISFTIMALLPTLGEHILTGMDVEGVTQELQSQSRASKAATPLPTPEQPSNSSVTSSVEVLPQSEPDARSENDSASIISSPTQDDATSTSDLAASSQSWVDHFSSMQSSQHASEAGPSRDTSSSSASGSHPNPDSPKSNLGTDLSDSVITTSSAISYGDVNLPPPAMVNSGLLQPPSTKAELWREVKMLTFTRTLTTLYSMTLLSLFTHIQLNILGRSKYIQSVLQQAQEDIIKEQFQDSLSISNLLWGGRSLESLESTDELQEVERISEQTETKYFTLSWWMLNVGWKDVGERVRRGVEEVFEGVSLKTKLSASDLHRLVSDVRRRVEFEITFEGKERRINFLSTLLPPTPEMLQHVLTQGGIPARQVAAPDSTFKALLNETRAQLSSASFQIVLESCLDRATEILFNGLEKNVFRETNVGGWEEASSTAISLGQERRVKLAGMLPGLARWSQLALEGLPNELVDGLAELREVSALSAIIYTSYEDCFR